METLFEDDPRLSSSHYDDVNDDLNSNVSNNTDADILRDRLNKVRKAVRKATQEAWKQADGHNPSPATLEKENSSFMLGMDLFGNGGGDIDGDTDSTMMPTSNGLEGAIRDKLQEVEGELRKLQKEINLNSHNPEEHEDTESTENLDADIEHYRRKVEFLKQASLARSCLEDSAALSSTALSSTTLAGKKGPYSGNDKETPDNLVRSAQLLLRSLSEVDEAERILELEDSSSTEQQKEIEVAHRILSSLRHQIRRHRVELVHRTGTVLSASVEVTPTSISVKSSAQLAIAYQVLETLDEGGSKSQSTALKETMREFTLHLYQEVLKPIITASVNSVISRRWKVEETVDQGSSMIGVSSGNKKGALHRIDWAVLEDENTTHDGTSETVLEEDDDLSFPVIRSWRNILSVLQRILVFIQSKVLLERETLCNLLGNRLFGTPNAMPGLMHLSALGLKSTLLGENDQGVLVEAMVEWLREQCLSNNAIEDGEENKSVSSKTLDRVTLLRKALLASTLPFIQEFQDRLIIPENPKSRLAMFCQDYEKEYVEHRRCVRLNQAREILIQNDYHNTVMVGVEANHSSDDLKEEALANFRLSRCSVSDSANKLMALVRNTMDEALAVSTSVPQDSPLAILRPTLYKTAREMFSLFSAIIQANHGREVANVPRTAAVLHNDSVFLAHHCLTLGLEYREKFPQFDEDGSRGNLLKQTCIFVDMVPLYREVRTLYYSSYEY